jgi:hypothetical protein
MTPSTSKTDAELQVPDFCLPATHSGTSLLAHLLSTSRPAQARVRTQRKRAARGNQARH